MDIVAHVVRAGDAIITIGIHLDKATVVEEITLIDGTRDIVFAQTVCWRVDADLLGDVAVFNGTGNAIIAE